MFASTSNLTINHSVSTHISLMMILARKYARLLTNLINGLYQNSNVSFSYIFLPVSEHNTKDYIDQSFKLASSGYSYLIPAIALGFSQKQIIDLKDLENTILSLEKRFVPLQSSYTQSASGQANQNQTAKVEENKSGGQEKAPEELSPKTEINKTNDAKK